MVSLCVTRGRRDPEGGPGPRVDTQPPLTWESNEQMLSELGKKYWVPPTRATLAGAAWLPRGAAGTGSVMVGFTGLRLLLVLRHLATWHRAPLSDPLPAVAPSSPTQNFTVVPRG